MTSTTTRRALLAAATAGLVLATTAAARAERQEITWWHAMSGANGERVQQLAKQFNESQDKYTVNAIFKGNYDELINGTIAAYRTKRAPELVQIYERGFMTMLLSDAIVPVYQLMADKGYKIDWNDFIKPVAGYYTYKGKLMTMPFNSSTPILYYNKEHFAKAGLEQPSDTWQGLETQLEKIKEAGIDCPAVLAGDYHWSWFENYSAINDQPYATRSNGYDGLDTELVFNKTLVVKQLARMKSWLDKGLLHMAGQGVSPESIFSSGKCSTYIASTAAHGGIEAGAKIAWSATFLPHEEGITPRNSTIGGATLWVMKGRSQKEYDATAAFLAFIAKPEIQVWWHKETGYVPATKTAYNMAKDEGYYKKSPTREIAILQLSRGTPTANSLGFRFGNFTQIFMAQREEFENVFAGKKTPQQAMDDAVARGNEILRKFETLHKGRY